MKPAGSSYLWPIAACNAVGQSHTVYAWKQFILTDASRLRCYPFEKLSERLLGNLLEISTQLKKNTAFPLRKICCCTQRKATPVCNLAQSPLGPHDMRFPGKNPTPAIRKRDQSNKGCKYLAHEMDDQVFMRKRPTSNLVFFLVAR